MKMIAIFVAGAVAAAGIVYFAMRGTPEAEPVTPLVVQQSAPAPVAPAEPAVETPPAPPAPVARPTPLPPKRPRQASRNPEPAPAPPAPVVAEAPKPAAAPPESPPPPSAPPAPAVVEAKAPPPPPAPRKVTLPVGTVISVRLGEALSTDTTQPGDAFTATLDQALVVDGLVIAERGAKAEGKVVESTKAGRVKGIASMTLELVRFQSSDRQKVEVHTDPFLVEGASETKKDAAKVGAAAGIGAAIGAIAGGGKGAAIGAAVGGAAGTGGVLATRGKPASLETETRVSFRLNQPVTVTEKMN